MYTVHDTLNTNYYKEAKNHELSFPEYHERSLYPLCRLQPSTAQHSTAQPSTAQASPFPHLLYPNLCPILSFVQMKRCLKVTR